MGGGVFVMNGISSLDFCFELMAGIYHVKNIVFQAPFRPLLPFRPDLLGTPEH